MIPFFSVKEETFSPFKEQKKTKVRYCNDSELSSQSVLCVCVCVNVLMCPDNLFKPRDRAVTGKEMRLRSKRWVPSHSPPWHVVRCFSSLGRFVLISCITFSCEGRSCIDDICLQNMLLLFLCQLFCSIIVSLPLSTPHLFAFPSWQILPIIRKIEIYTECIELIQSKIVVR